MDFLSTLIFSSLLIVFIGAILTFNKKKLKKNNKNSYFDNIYNLNKSLKQGSYLNQYSYENDNKNFNSHYKNESLYEDHNITMILKMSHSDDEEERSKLDNNDRDFKNLNQVYYKDNNLKNNNNDSDLSGIKSKLDYNKKDSRNKNIALNEYNSNFLNKEIENELNNRNNQLDKLYFNNKIDYEEGFTSISFNYEFYF